MRPIPCKASPRPSVTTSDIDAAAWLYAQNLPLLTHQHDGQRTVFTFQATEDQLHQFYGPEGESARQLLLARRTLLGLVHGGRR